jgi:hypothetical protein
MSSVYYTGPRNNPNNGALRVYEDGLVVQATYPSDYKGGKKRTPEEINKKEGKLKTVDKNKLFSDEEEEWSLSAFWDDYYMYIISIFLLIAAITIFLYIKN